MKPEPLDFSFPVADVDLAKLPIDPALLKADKAMLEDALSGYFAEQFKPLGGEASIAIRNGAVAVRWIPEAGLDALVDHGIRLLGKGDTNLGVALLRSALARMPDVPCILLNLGMALSDQGELDEALALLGRKTQLEPDDAEGWTALGVALAKSGDPDHAAKALTRSIELDPENGYGHLNLGGLLMRSDPQAGMQHLEKAAKLLPRNTAALLNWGMALLENGQTTEADAAMERTIATSPLSEHAEKARTIRTRIAQEAMRGRTKGALRPDAAMYCLSALRLFAESPDKLQPVTFEITLLGRQGLDMNDPTPKYTLKTLPGQFSGLQLVSYLYVGMKKLAPDADPGIDLAREYEQAQALLRERTG